jgi:hypothetical protein
MDLNISVNSSYPANTYCLMGSVGNNNLYVDLTLSDEETKSIVNNVIEFFGPNIGITVSNYDITNFFDVSIVIPEETYLNNVTLDYNNLNNNEKLIIDQFVGLVLSSVDN